MLSPLFGANRRGFLALAAAFALASPALADAAKPESKEVVKVPIDALMAEPPLPDLWLGDAKAPITMIEYASMTCSHCADWNVHAFPALKTKFIDTGKVRYVLREFPLDPLAAGASMLARCSGDKREAMVELLFQQQPNWAFVKNPLEALRNVVKQTGMGEQAFDSCLNDQGLFDKVNATRDAGEKKFGVNATPTFFINGEKHPGEIPADQFDAVFAPWLK